MKLNKFLDTKKCFSKAKGAFLWLGHAARQRAGRFDGRSRLGETQRKNGGGGAKVIAGWVKPNAKTWYEGGEQIAERVD